MRRTSKLALVSLAGIALAAGCTQSASSPRVASEGSPPAVIAPQPISGLPAPIGTPPFPRSLAAVAYDPLTGQTVMFGGISAYGTLPDTWTWDGANWTQHHSPTGPHGRNSGVMAFDPAAGGVVLIGGDPNAPYTDDAYADMRVTWVWRGSSWQRLATLHTPVPENTGAGWSGKMAYDAATGELVLVDIPFWVGHLLNCTEETWTFDGADWRKRSPIAALPADTRVLVSDGTSGAVLAVMYPRSAIAPVGFQTATCPTGSFDARAIPTPATFMWTGSTWTQVAADGPPRSPVEDAGGTTFASHAALVQEDGAVWLWTGSAWQLQSTATVPSDRSDAAIAQDRNGRLLLFGGLIQASPWDLGDTWLWDGRRWARVPVTGPPASAAR